MKFNYQKICAELLAELPNRQKETLLRRFGLKTGTRETLESIGSDFGITRERVRQIEKDGIGKIAPRVKKYQKVWQYFERQIKNTGGLRKEDVLLSQLGGENCRQHTFFLLTLAEPFSRFAETDEFHSFWSINPTSFERAKKVVKTFYEKLLRVKKPLSVSSPTAEYFLEISKAIQKNSEGFFGLKTWPEINPRSIKDKAFVALKKAGKPLHFQEVAKAIGPDALAQTVHNELIRDPRFVLVGRGLYGLKDWGFKQGVVKDVILDILKTAGRPLAKEELLKRVLEQRLVKRNTILLNLSDKKYFFKTAEGKYLIQEA